MTRALTPAVALMLVAGATVPPPKPAAPPAPELEVLLERVAESEGRLLELYETGSFVVRSTIRQIDGKGRKTSEAAVETRMFSRDGKPWEEIVRFEEDGEDLTASRNEKRQRELESGKRTRKDGLPFESPFARDQQKRYRFEDLGEDPSEPGVRRIRFTPRRKSEAAYAGEAKVDTTTHALVEMTFRPSVLPRFVSRFEVTMEMRARTALGPALSSLRVSAAGGVLFVKKSVEVEATFSDYEE